MHLSEIGTNHQSRVAAANYPPLLPLRGLYGCRITQLLAHRRHYAINLRPHLLTARHNAALSPR